MDMTGKFVLVTGAASGIGRGAALRYAERGAAAVACLDIHADSARETARQIEALGARALAVQADLGSVDEIRSAYAQVADAFGRLDAAALIGGYSWRGETLDVTEAQWDAVIGVNLRGSFFCCQEALRIMYPQGAGAIVAMSADAAFHPIEGFAVQAAGKGGIVHMCQTLALEGARRGVRVNVVSPGIVRVQQTGAPRPAGPELRREGAAPVADLAAQTASGEWNTVEQVADAFVFLSSEAASGISGQLVQVNRGGYPTLQY